MEDVSELKIERDACLPSVEAVPRSSVTGTAIILAVIVMLSAFMVMPRTLAVWAVWSVASLAVLAIITRAVQAIHISLFASLWIGLPFIFPALKIYPLTLFVPLVIYGMVVAVFPSLRNSLLWLRSGKLSSDVRALVLATIIVSSLALVGWYLLLKPDISSHLAQVPRLSIWVLPFVAVGFAMLNAAMEEFAFRGIVMQALDSAIGVGNLSILLQAISFGLLHYVAGFPNGALGLAMVCLYGFMLGMLRRRSRGILAPWLAHVLADVVIFGILATIVVAS
jgi:membrane protease YdiL (CAAX protease family)